MAEVVDTQQSQSTPTRSNPPRKTKANANTTQDDSEYEEGAQEGGEVVGKVRVRSPKQGQVKCQSTTCSTYCEPDRNNGFCSKCAARAKASNFTEIAKGLQRVDKIIQGINNLPVDSQTKKILVEYFGDWERRVPLAANSEVITAIEGSYAAFFKAINHELGVPDVDVD